jgi:hypothetical protein
MIEKNVKKTNFSTLCRKIFQKIIIFEVYGFYNLLFLRIKNFFNFFFKLGTIFANNISRPWACNYIIRNEKKLKIKNRAQR